MAEHDDSIVFLPWLRLAVVFYIIIPYWIHAPMIQKGVLVQLHMYRGKLPINYISMMWLRVLFLFRGGAFQECVVKQPSLWTQFSDTVERTILVASATEGAFIKIRAGTTPHWGRTGIFSD